MKAENSRMVEEMQKMQEDFGMVSCPGILRSCPSLCCPATPALQPLEAPSMKGTRRDEQEGCPRLFMGIVGCWVKGSSQPTWSPPLSFCQHCPREGRSAPLPTGQAGGRGHCLPQTRLLRHL